MSNTNIVNDTKFKDIPATRKGSPVLMSLAVVRPRPVAWSRIEPISVPMKMMLIFRGVRKERFLLCVIGSRESIDRNRRLKMI